MLLIASQRHGWFGSGVLAAALLFVFGLRQTHGFTEWAFVELYSSPDGAVQFIELYTDFDAQNVLAGQSIFINGIPAYTFTNVGPSPLNLPAATADHSLLLATQQYTWLPGAPAPDVVLPPGPFFPASGPVVLGFGSPDPSPILYDQVTFIFDWSLEENQSLNWPFGSGSPVGTVEPARPRNFDDVEMELDCCTTLVPLPPAFGLLGVTMLALIMRRTASIRGAAFGQGSG